MMFFGNNFNMNYGLGYNPFAMGNFCNPNYNFMTGGLGYGGYMPSSYSTNPLNSVFSGSYSPYGAYSPYNSYDSFGSYGSYNNLGGFSSYYPQTNYYSPQMAYGSMSPYNFYQPSFNTQSLPGLDFSEINNILHSTNPISSQKPSTEVTNYKTKTNYKEKDLNKNGDDYGPEFLKKVKEISKRLNCNYKDLLGVMNSESGINAKAQNKNGGASGLIQFMPKTAEMLGTTTDALRAMSPIDQLDYVEECIKRCKKMAGMSENQKLSGGQLYALIFLPARANREVLTTSDEAYYKANKGLDANNDGKITKTELDERVARFRVSDKSFLA